MVKVWASRGSSTPWQGKFCFKWSNTFEILGIHYEITEMGEISKPNILRKLGVIRKLIRVFGSRYLTPYRKVTLIKSVLISKIIHMLPSQNVLCIKEINNTFSNLLWCGKPPSLLKGDIHCGDQRRQSSILVEEICISMYSHTCGSDILYCG